MVDNYIDRTCSNGLGKIGLIFYGEDGEVEYGGSTETEKDPIFDVSYMQKIYLEDGIKPF